MKKYNKTVVAALYDAIRWRESYLDSINGIRDMEKIINRNVDLINNYKSELLKCGLVHSDPFSGCTTVSLEEIWNSEEKP